MLLTVGICSAMPISAAGSASRVAWGHGDRIRLDEYRVSGTLMRRFKPVEALI
jgi:hypothetical protein